MAAKLYIVGNGFDRHHGIPSDYRDFARFLAQHDSQTYRAVESYFAVDDDFWWEFETRLAEFDVESAIDYASQFLLSYADDNWRDSANHDYQYELDQIVRRLSQTLRERFAEWVRLLPLPDRSASTAKLLPIDPNAAFLTFNYTATLEKLYGVPLTNILHIHGNSDDDAPQIILGHGWKRRPEDSLNHRIDPEAVDTRIIEGNRIVDGYFEATFKPTDRILEAHRTFFAGLRAVREIYVMGHSLADVDSPYFREIIRNIDTGSTRWKFSYHHNLAQVQERVSSYGLATDLVQFSRLSDF